LIKDINLQLERLFAQFWQHRLPMAVGNDISLQISITRWNLAGLFATGFELPS
jgi:hypothetical protein